MAAVEEVGRARLRYLGTSAQKARLVVDLIRGQRVGEAMARLRFTQKHVARDVARLLDSAVANAQQKRQDLDVDQLYVKTAFVDGGPSLKRMCHVTLGLGEMGAPVAPVSRPKGPAAAAAETGQEKARPAGPRKKAAAGRKAGVAARSKGAKGSSRKSSKAKGTSGR
ncbi:MAG TPA: 50S ribosomal protein L22 [Candidatus Polarisedimenticolia bacterium]